MPSFISASYTDSMLMRSPLHADVISGKLFPRVLDFNVGKTLGRRLNQQIFYTDTYNRRNYCTLKTSLNNSYKDVEFFDSCGKLYEKLRVAKAQHLYETSLWVIIYFLRLFFRQQKEETSIPSGYIENERSMLKLLYDNVFFVARKPLWRERSLNTDQLCLADPSLLSQPVWLAARSTTWLPAGWQRVPLLKHACTHTTLYSTVDRNQAGM